MVVFIASFRLLIPRSLSWVLVITLTDWGVSLGDNAKPVVVFIAEVV